MELLMTLDEHNYTDDMPVCEKTTVRAIIRRNGLYSMQKSAAGWYKIPGGGIDPGETEEQTLTREIQEEVGLVLIPSSMVPIGEIIEKRQDRKKAGQIFLRHSLYYFCNVEDREVPTSMTASELALGFHPVWVSSDEIIRSNIALGIADRDTDLIRMLADRAVPSTSI